MAIRGGLGVFYNRSITGANPVIGPPVRRTPIVYYGTMPTLLSSSGLLFPQGANSYEFSPAAPAVYNMSLSVQRNIGFGTVVDVGYVGSLGRHLPWVRDLGTIPFGANFDPRNADPANPRVPLPAAFLRPYPGFQSIGHIEWAGSSTYHSLQATANRRFARGLQFGAAWTWSKALDYNDNDNETISTLVSPRVWNYGLASFDRTHVLKLNWLWDVPRTPWRGGPLNWIFNDWRLSGITSFVSGAPLGAGFTQVAATDITGTPSQAARIVVLDNPVLPKSERTFSRNFRTDVFAAPAVGTIGNAAKTLIRGPGINNWDIAILKSFPVREPLRLQFRCEIYNAFNHTQFQNLDTTARFDAQGRQVNARLGEFTSARPARIMQFALRLSF
jgi:hypothetical protein